MEEKIRLAVGILGNASSMLLYIAPTFTFSRVIRKKSTEEFSCLPYIITLLSCLLYAWYGLPAVSNKWENFPLVTINGLGILLELSFVLIYFYFASANGKKKVVMLIIPVLLVSGLTAIISMFAYHDHHHRKVFVGSVGVVVSVAMYSSPLVVVKQVMQTKSVEYMPFYLSFFSFISSLLWMAYGLLSHDLFIASPSLVGSPLGFLQLLLYFKYRNGEITEPPQKWDLENNCQKPIQASEESGEKPVKEEKDDKKEGLELQLVVVDATNGED